MAESLLELQAREAEVEREWQWLHDVLNKVARVRAEQEDAQAFRLLQHQAMQVGMRRVELRIRMEELRGPALSTAGRHGVMQSPHGHGNVRPNGGHDDRFA